MSKQTDLKSIEKLASSRGWKLVEEVMNAEILSAAKGLASSQGMATDEMHFRRGAIWAAQQLVTLPEALRLRLESEIALEEQVRLASERIAGD